MLLRLALFAVNPPDNAYDDHYGPIGLIVENGALPAKDACWECYHPPAFYLSSAWVAHAALALDLPLAAGHKLLQFLSCLWGLLTLPVLWALLRRLPVPDAARVVAFGTACLLPRLVYMSAMHSNDTLAVLAVSVVALLLLALVQDGPRPRVLLALALSMALAVLTKYTGLVVLPMALAAGGAACWRRLAPGRARWAALTAAVLVLPLLAFAAIAVPNLRQYGRALPSNIELLHPEWLESGEDRLPLEYFGFRVWTVIGVPILSPENRAALWPLVTGRMWFDMEPKFLPWIDPAVPGWWAQYETFLGSGDETWPGTAALSRATLATGSSLVGLGLLPLLLLLAGGARTVVGRLSVPRASDPATAVALVALPVLFAANVAGMALTCVKFPYYFSMKAAYVMTGLPAYVAFLALGLALLEGRPRARRLVHALLALLWLLATAHLVHLVLAMAAHDRPPW